VYSGAPERYLVPAPHVDYDYDKSLFGTEIQAFLKKKYEGLWGP
jgi:hypothetical protein